ncbi:hypothetical protein BKA70DRAFT_1426656 [Coprinopsis sp. MPI-PUGE-AT-0042]|nr:hypothetical protein BKA70DRAFT_1426656 [Coprinopsis sp. MPI-PUGE-AT-0042]
MKLTTAFTLVLAQAMTLVAAQGCAPYCCDAVVPSTQPVGFIGIKCFAGGIDCGFSGQIPACCQGIASPSSSGGTGIGCNAL